MIPKPTYEAIFMRRNTLVRRCRLSAERADKIFRSALKRKGHCLIIAESGEHRTRLIAKVNAVEETDET